MTTYLWLRFLWHKGFLWFDPLVYGFLGVFPIAMNLLHGDRPPDSGLRVDNLTSSAKEVGLATGAMAAAAVLTGLVVGGWHWKSWGHLLSRVARYAGWGLVQQYFLQAFALRRLRQALVPTPAAVIAAATVFGLLHAPNWPLVALTSAAGVVWCALFVRRPNLITLAVAHGALAVLIYYVLPEHWLHKLAVGGIYLREIGRAGM
jgi:membrane protease YdiL (CAAX protease family)